MHFFNTTVTPQAIELVRQTLESTFLSEGSVVEQFEQAILREVPTFRRPIAVNSGTAALHLALIGAGVQPGDEVITTPQTFVATALAILYVGAIPVFADIDPLTGNLTPESVESKITDNTLAILGVDWAGYPFEIYEICNLAELHGLSVIDDAAHAFGATYRGRSIADQRTDYTCFSFQSIKHVTTGGDGGAVLPKWENERLRRLRWFGISKTDHLPDELGERQYVLHEPGYKLHMNNVAAACGLGNLVNFKGRLAHRRAIAKRYFTELNNVPGLTLMQYKLDRESAYWLFPVLVENRLGFVRKLKERGVPTGIVHARIDRHPLFGGKRTDLPGMDYFDARQIHLPMHDALTDDDISLVIDTIKGGW